MTRVAVVAALVWLTAAAGAQDAAPHYRIVESATGGTVDLDRLAGRAASADIVLIGEHHDNAPTHAVQRALFAAIAERRSNVSLALEMFERDVQETLDHFQMGHISEDDLLASVRPWPDYARFYKPLVDLAVAREWSLVAANVPRSIAADVARDGLTALAARPPADRALYAAELDCDPSGPYFDRFVEALGTHGQTLGAAERQPYYESQCLKDETMAESIAQVYAAAAAGGSRPLVISLHGAVHMEYRLGTVERVVRRLPRVQALTVTMVPTENLGTAVRAPRDPARADFVVFVEP